MRLASIIVEPGNGHVNIMARLGRISWVSYTVIHLVMPAVLMFVTFDGCNINFRNL